MSKRTTEILICIVIGALIAIFAFIIMDSMPCPSYLAFKDVPWSADAAHRAAFNTNPTYLT